MKKVKALILRTAGINCDYETQTAFELSGAVAKRYTILMFLLKKKMKFSSLIFWLFQADFLTVTT